MRPLTARERRLLAIGLLVLALGVIWLGAIRPLVGGFSDRAQERRHLKAELSRDQNVIASAPLWRLAAQDQRRDAARFAIAAPSEPVAVEALQARLQRLANDEGFTVSSVEDLQAEAPAGLVRVRADMTISLTQLAETVRRLESEGAYVVVDYLSISADQALATGKLSPMAVRLELSAAYRPLRTGAP